MRPMRYDALTVINLLISLLAMLGGFFGVGQKSDVLTYVHGAEHDVRLTVSNGVFGHDNAGFYVCEYSQDNSATEDNGCDSVINADAGDLYTIATILMKQDTNGHWSKSKTISQAYAAFYDYAKTHKAASFDE